MGKGEVELFRRIEEEPSRNNSKERPRKKKKKLALLYKACQELRDGKGKKKSREGKPKD